MEQGNLLQTLKFALLTDHDKLHVSALNAVEQLKEVNMQIKHSFK